MKIIVFSDSHGDVDTMERIVGILKPDMVIHLGDFIGDAVELERRIVNLKLEFVKGNCDLWSVAADEKILDAGDIRIMITHGDKYGVRTGYSTLLREGREKADVVLCGHTHIPHLAKKRGLWLMNPGKVGRNARGPSKPSFGILELDGGIECHIEKVNSVL